MRLSTNEKRQRTEDVATLLEAGFDSSADIFEIAEALFPSMLDVSDADVERWDFIDEHETWIGTVPFFKLESIEHKLGLNFDGMTEEEIEEDERALDADAELRGLFYRARLALNSLDSPA